MNIREKTNEISLGIATILFYFLASFMCTPIYIFLHANEMPIHFRYIWNIIYQILIVAIILLLNHKVLSEKWKDMKLNHKKYFGENFKYYLIGLAIMMISNVIIIFILKLGISKNEQAIRNILNNEILYSYISGVLIAPIMEEIVFRQGFKYIFKNRYIFILTSGLLFGALHVITNLTSTLDFIYLIPYCSLGITFAYIFEKTNNIFTTIGLHFMHNGILISLQILVLLFN